MEIYRNRNGQVFRLGVPILEGATYEIFVSSRSSSAITGTESQTLGTMEPGDGYIDVPINITHTVYDGEVTVTAEITHGAYTFSIDDRLDVITPIFTAEDLEGTGYDPEKVPELERLVRKVIETYTGQSFGKRIGVVHSTTAQDTIRFNAPLLMLTDLSWGGRYAPLSTTLNPPKIPHETIEDGYGLVIDWQNYDPKTDSLWIIRSDTPRIVNIEGIFGFDRVPQDVKEAALLIAGVWGTKQAVWRDRFIQTMRSADWSVQYHERAFLSTGSVTADQLLSKYQRTALPEVF